MSGAIRTLFLPFEAGELGPPAAGEKWAFLNASVPEGALPAGLSQALACEQGFRPEYLRLQRAGLAVEPELGDMAGIGGCLVLAGKHKGENHAMIARAARMAAPGKPVVIAGDKNLGISSLRKWVSDRVGIEGSLAKHHATVFWFEAPESEIFDRQELPEPLEGRFETAPGMFSFEKIDPGSKLLAEHFSPKITGNVADFGAGWGYLSARLLEAGSPAALTLFEAHYPSLCAAKRNVGKVAGNLPVTANWLDLTSEPVARQFDWIVMNPPFHAARAAEPDIGKAFIKTASGALKPGGRLLMVANRKLPYEHALAQGFRRVTPVDDRDGFKVIEAMR